MSTENGIIYCPNCNTLAGLDHSKTLDDLRAKLLAAEQENERLRNFLGMLIDLSTEQIPKPMWEKSAEYRCKYCGDKNNKPEVRHKHNCIVAQAKQYLQQNTNIPNNPHGTENAT